MKRLLLAIVLCVLSLLTSWAQTTIPAVSITVKNGMASSGGYVETADGQPQYGIAYSTIWPETGYIPVFYIHFPVGKFTVKTNYGKEIKVDVRQVETATDILLHQKARSFTFTVPADGWYRLALTGGIANVTTLQDFTITTSTGSDLNQVFLASWRSAPSLHLNGFGSSDPSMPSGTAFDWIYDEVMIPEDADYVGTYCEAFGFNNSYIGLQNNCSTNHGTDHRTIIFSCWDDGDTDKDPELADFKRSSVVCTGVAEEVNSTRFGGEGTGASVRLQGNLWKAGQWVKFLVNSRPEQICFNDGSTYNNTLLSAWYWAEGIDTEWHYIGTIRKAGKAGHMNPYNAFLEEYTRSNTSQGNARHKAYYRHVFTRSADNGTWYNRNRFWWGHTDGDTNYDAANNPHPRNDRYQDIVEFDNEQAALMMSGGYFEPFAGTSTMRLKSPDGIVPKDATLQQLLKQNVEPVAQRQDEYRMALAISKIMRKLNQTEWTVAAYSSQETAGEESNGRASMVTDNDVSTYWHTQWTSTPNASYPHSLTLMHQGDVTIDQIRLTLPRGRSATYSSKKVIVSKSSNGSSWTAIGTYDLDASDSQTITFDQSITTTYLKFDFLEGNGSQHLVIGEILFYQKDSAALKALDLHNKVICR